GPSYGASREGGVGGKRPLLDDDRSWERACHGALLRSSGRLGRRQQDRSVRLRGQPMQPLALIALEAHERHFPSGPVHSAVRLLEPALTLSVQVGIVQEDAAVDEVAPDVADGALHLALGPGTVGAAGAGPKAPVRGKAQELLVDDKLAAQEAQVLGDHRLHLIEEKLLGHATEEVKRLFEATEQAPHVLAAEVAEVLVAGVAEHDDERVALAPGAAELGEVHLPLLARGRLEAVGRLGGRGAGPHTSHVVAKLRVATRVAGRLDFLQKTDGGELGIVLEPLQ